MKFKIGFIIGFIFLIAWSMNIKAQDFSWKAPVSNAKEDGFHKILVSPNIVSKLENGFSDIRIYDNDDNEIPFIFESEKSINYKDYFVEYKIIEKKEQNKWPYYTRLIIHNPKKNKISNFQLIIRNSDVSKSLKLSGSDDKSNWYIIRDGYRFHSMYSDESTSVIKIIDFPVSNYEYYEILIDDWKNNPINILKAGYFNTSIEEGMYTSVDKPEINQLQLKEERQSLVKIIYPEKQKINKITFGISGPEFYFREAEIQVKDSSLNKRKEYEYYFKTISTITLSSNSLNTWYFDNVTAQTIYLRISNYDNSPLEVTSVLAEQLNNYLICKLEKSKKYTLKFGNEKLATPVYDLKYFKNDIPKKLPFIEITAIASISQKEKLEQTGIHLDNKFIWIAIAIVMAFLIYMVVKMLKDMKTNKTE